MINTEFKIEDGRIILADIKKAIRCKNCKSVVALKSDNTMLIKGLSLFDSSKKNMLIKCNECKTYNVLNIKSEKNDKKIDI